MHVLYLFIHKFWFYTHISRLSLSSRWHQAQHTQAHTYMCNLNSCFGYTVVVVAVVVYVSNLQPITF